MPSNDQPAATTRAVDGNRTIYFTDLVREGEVVPVYPTYEDAEEERGASVPMRVCRDEDDWWLEAVDAE